MKGIKNTETLKLTFKETAVDADKNEPITILVVYRERDLPPCC